MSFIAPGQDGDSRKASRSVDPFFPATRAPGRERCKRIARERRRERQTGYVVENGDRGDRRAQHQLIQRLRRDDRDAMSASGLIKHSMIAMGRKSRAIVRQTTYRKIEQLPDPRQRFRVE
jgi:glucose-6-phosphate-specific signal transduction histidine kinase